MKYRIAILGVLSASLLGCSQPSTDTTGAGTTGSGATTSSSADTCKDFPAQELVYSPNTSCSSSKGDGSPTRYTLSLETSDPIDKVHQWYRSSPAGAGWQPEPDDPAATTATHKVVVLKKAPGYATATLFSQGSGTSLQVHLYPEGG